MSVVKSADILLPAGADYEKWSVIACDQYTSDKDYWDDVEKIVGNSESTLRLILPEAWIGTEKAEGLEKKISDNMRQYTDNGVFRELKASYMLVEREMQDGSVRTGIIAAIDLEQYDYAPETDVMIKATERTVQERLYKRLDVRKTASLEFPHVLVFYNDPDRIITTYLAENENSLKQEYSFSLMKNGGKIRGRYISGETAGAITKLFDTLEKDAVVRADRENGKYPVMLAVGDGNHSLATAKLSWDLKKKQLTAEEAEKNPSRYALVELINVYDAGISIKPIHRLVSGCDTAAFAEFAAEYFREYSGKGEEKELTVGTGSGEVKLYPGGLSTGELTGHCDKLIEEYISKFGGEEDYIHGDEEVRQLGSRPGCGYIMLPAIQRDEVFKTAEAHKIFPKKCFSIGEADEKRFYLEGRRI